MSPNAKDFHLTSTIGEVRVSTVRLPFRHINGEYETCLFQRHPTGVGDSDVVERYETEEQARSGHDAWTRRVEEHGFEARHAREWKVGYFRLIEALSQIEAESADAGHALAVEVLTQLKSEDGR